MPQRRPAAILAKTFLATIYVLAHGFVSLVLVCIITAIEWVLIHGGDPKIFDFCPWRYVFDVVDLAVVGVFLWFGTREAIGVFGEGEDEPEEEEPVHA